MRSGVLRWKDHARWSEWIPFTNDLGSIDTPNKYALPEMLENCSQNVGYSQPPEMLLDSIELNSNGVTGVKSETHCWAYHLDQLVWYAIPKTLITSIQNSYRNVQDKSQYTIKHGAVDTLPGMPASSTGIHEKTTPGWNGIGNLEFFVEKYTSDSIQIINGIIPKPIRLLPEHNGFIFAFNYLDASSILLPYNQLIAVPYRELDGSIHWIPITCGVFYEFGKTSKQPDDSVKLTGWAAFRCQTGVWKLVRNNKIVISTNKPDCFFAILNLEVPPLLLDGYSITGYWALHQSGIFYEVDRESYIRIQQANQTNKDTMEFFNPDASIFLNNSFVENSNILAPAGLEVMDKVDTPAPPKTQIDFSNLPESFQRTTEAELVQIWNPTTREWKTVVKDLLLGGNFQNKTIPFSIIGMRLATQVQDMIESVPILTQNLTLANQAYQKMSSELAAYEFKSNLYIQSEKIEEKLKLNLDTLKSYLIQVQETLTYYNETRYSSMDENQVKAIGSKAQGWTKLAPEILEDINTQAAVILSFHQIGIEMQKSEINGIIAKIHSSVSEMESWLSQINTAKTHANINMAKAEELKLQTANLPSNKLREFNIIFSAMSNSHDTLLTSLDASVTLLTKVKDSIVRIDEQNLDELKTLAIDLEQERQDLFEMHDTVLTAATAINLCFNQLSKIIDAFSITTQSTQEQSPFQFFLIPFRQIWTCIVNLFIILTQFALLPVLITARIFRTIFRS